MNMTERLKVLDETLRTAATLFVDELASAITRGEIPNMNVGNMLMLFREELNKGRLMGTSLHIASKTLGCVNSLTDHMAQEIMEDINNGDLPESIKELGNRILNDIKRTKF